MTVVDVLTSPLTLYVSIMTLFRRKIRNCLMQQISICNSIAEVFNASESCSQELSDRNSFRCLPILSSHALLHIAMPAQNENI